MYETLGREEGSRSAIGTKQICENDRKVHCFAYEHLFISHNSSFFMEFLTSFTRKNWNCKIPCTFEDICKKHLEIRDFT